MAKAESRGWDILGASYFGAESGEMKGQNLAESGAMDGGVSETKRTCQRVLGAGPFILLREAQGSWMS